MIAGAFLSFYLVIGLACAGLMAYAIKRATDPDDSISRDPGAQSALSDLEAGVSRLPGGIISAFAVVTLFWPGLVAIFIRNKMAHRH
jgi:hypothetical protein